MSTSDEIRAVYEEDIFKKSKFVESKYGKSPFYNNFDGFYFEDIYANSGAELIICSEYTPKRKKWSRKYGKSLGEKS